MLWVGGNGRGEEGASYSLEVEQKEQGIAGIYHGGVISGEAPFPAREERKVTSRTRQPSVLTGGTRLAEREGEKKEEGRGAGCAGSSRAGVRAGLLGWPS